MKELLKKLCLEFGPSGFEDGVKAIISAKLKELSTPECEIIEDNLGGIYFHIPKKGAPRLMVNAHMDEIALMVTGATDSGALRFERVGGIDPIILLSKRVISENGVNGVISSKPIHLLDKEERKKKPSVDKMLINIGAKTKEEALTACPVGTYFAFESDFVEMGNKIKAKALDDRHGCTEMLSAIEMLSKNGFKSKYDLFFAFTTREEISYSGAYCATEIIRPDYAIVIESKAVLDLPGVSDSESVASLGKGALISYADRGAIMNRELTEALVECCKENEIKYQINRAVSGGNDSATIQKSALGARVALVSAPSRYIHSPSSVVDMDDLTAIRDLIFNFVKE